MNLDDGRNSISVILCPKKAKETLFNIMSPLFVSPGDPAATKNCRK